MTHKDESTDVILYTYQTETMKPVCMAYRVASLMELIDSAHVVPHGGGGSSLLVDPPPDPAQALCVWDTALQESRVTCRDEATGNKIEPE